MKVYIVLTTCEYYEDGNGNLDEVFATEELAKRYCADWDYRNNYEIKEVDVRETYKETRNGET